jgi:hypothetical protein
MLRAWTRPERTATPQRVRRAERRGKRTAGARGPRRERVGWRAPASRPKGGQGGAHAPERAVGGPEDGRGAGEEGAPVGPEDQESAGEGQSRAGGDFSPGGDPVGAGQRRRSQQAAQVEGQDDQRQGQPGATVCGGGEGEAHREQGPVTGAQEGRPEPQGQEGRRAGGAGGEAERGRQHRVPCGHGLAEGEEGQQRQGPGDVRAPDAGDGEKDEEAQHEEGQAVQEFQHRAQRDGHFRPPGCRMQNAGCKMQDAGFSCFLLLASCLLLLASCIITGREGDGKWARSSGCVPKL